MSAENSGQTKSDGIRINELGRELGVKAKAILDYLPEIGITEKKTHSAWISDVAAQKVRGHFREVEEAIGTIDVKNAKPAAQMKTLSPAIALSRPLIRRDQASARSIYAPRENTSPLPRPRTLADVLSAESNPVTLQLPRKFTFHRGFLDFDYVLACFNWSLKGVPVVIDLSTCESANYQALALLVQYAWFLTMRGCRVTLKYGVAGSGPTKMLSKMGALDWLQVLTMDGRGFGTRPDKMFALRRRADVQNTINTARRAIQN